MADSISGIGLKGVQQGLTKLAQHTQETMDAFSGLSERDPVEPLIEMKQDIFGIRASHKVIQVGQKLEDEVLNILA